MKTRSQYRPLFRRRWRRSLSFSSAWSARLALCPGKELTIRSADLEPTNRNGSGVQTRRGQLSNLQYGTRLSGHPQPCAMEQAPVCESFKHMHMHMYPLTASRLE